MGVPAFFRWLSRKYPSIVVHCVENKPREVNGVKEPIDITQPNPNDIEFDNLYLDMNGIIHPCTHPEDKPPPKNEDEMMVLIFEYIDRLMSVVRPRKVLYMAIDGVAPRAKMNQQRSRRFRASKESAETSVEIARMREELITAGHPVPATKPASERFDSNCITPGTPFMFHLADCLRFYIHDRLNNDPGWKDIKVILSDANVPGEGEHKIMDYIRRQRAQPDHDPNTKHCLCGADADLIMLGLATHEPNFTIIREEFLPNKPKPCPLCGALGHELKECKGDAKEKSGEFDEMPQMVPEETAFIFLRLNVLRESLEHELQMTGLPFKYDFERALDDWVLMCFFVGNDFLPHLPSLEIREGAIDRLVRLYKNTVTRTGGWITDSGVVSLDRVQLIMQQLGEAEDEIFKKRRKDELGFRAREKAKKQRMRRSDDKPRYIPGGMMAPQALGNRGHSGLGFTSGRGIRQEGREARTQGYSAGQGLSAMMSQDGNRGEKRKLEEEEEPEPEDEVKLWEDGWKDRYYKSKFDVDENDVAFRHTVAMHYVRGLCWVLGYYYQGCPSWKWYFPYHYAPFASDFVNVAEVSNSFEKDTEPFKPLEQLMGVFPAGSKKHVPPTWQDLMTNPDSPIIDFYPTDFKIDLNGKKYAWQGVALLPFVDEKRLWKALDTVYPDCTPAENKRNIRGNDRIFVHSSHTSHSFFEAIYESSSNPKSRLECNPSLTQGLGGTVWGDEFVNLTGETVKCPLPTLHDVPDNRVISVQYQDPQFDKYHLFSSKVLEGAVFPERTLKPEDFNKNHPGIQFRPQLGFKPNSGYRGRKDMGPANRMISSGVGGGGGGGRGRGCFNCGENGHIGRDCPQKGGGGGGGSYAGGSSSYGNSGGNYGSSGGNYGNSGGNYGASGGYQGRQQSSYSGNQGGGNVAWQRNLQGQSGANQRNLQSQSSGYSRHSQGSDSYGQGQGSSQGQTYGGQSQGSSYGGYSQGGSSYGGSYNTSGSGGGSSSSGGGGSSSYNSGNNPHGGSNQRSSGGGGSGNNRYGNNQSSGSSQYPPPPSYQQRR